MSPPFRARGVFQKCAVLYSHRINRLSGTTFCFRIVRVRRASAFPFDLPVLYTVNNIAFFDRLQTMCNNNQCLMTMQAVDRFHDRSLCIVIQCAGRFIQNENLRIFKQRSRNSDSLTLTTGNPDAALANAGIQPFGKTADKLIQTGFLSASQTFASSMSSSA